MCEGLLINLLLAHFLGDFAFQTDKLSKQKKEKKTASWFMYIHAVVIAALSILALWDIRLWAIAVVMGSSHLLIDIRKSYIKEETLCVFLVDQLLHLAIITGIWVLCGSLFSWQAPEWMSPDLLRIEVVAIAAIICWKPANIIIKELLKTNAIIAEKEEGQDGEEDKLLHAGKMIGTLERWLILVFLLLGKYEVIGFLIAAKSIIRFGEDDRNKTEYFLAGTLLSFFLAVVLGLSVRFVFGLIL